MKTADRLRHFCLNLVGVVVLVTLAACSPAPAGTYSTPEEAVQALGDLAGSGDVKKTEEMFGADALDMFDSGDEVADHEDALRVKAMIREKVAFEDLDETSKAAIIGNEEWLLPLPLVQEDGRWRFDAAAGREELLNRRIGRNELLALASLHAYVDAQREYFTKGRDGKSAGVRAPLPEQRRASTTASTGRLRRARRKVRSVRSMPRPRPMHMQNADMQPFHGYYFRMLGWPGQECARRRAQLPGQERPLDAWLCGHWLAREIRQLGRHDFPGQPAGHRLPEGPRRRNGETLPRRLPLTILTRAGIRPATDAALIT